VEATPRFLYSKEPFESPPGRELDLEISDDMSMDTMGDSDMTEDSLEYELIG